MPKVVVVGGGISGLTLAYRLERLRPDADIFVLEKETTVGGTIRTESVDGFRVEFGPNGFLDNKPAVVDLCRELGLHDRLLAASEAAARNRYLFLDGRLRQLPTGLVPFLRTDLLTWSGKFALLTERFRRRGPDVLDESVDSFARRRVGAEVTEKLVDAFVTGIHAGDPQLLSVRAAFPRLAVFERDHGSITRGFRIDRRNRLAAGGRPSGRMWSFGDGLQVLINTLRCRLKRPPQIGTSVTLVRRTGDRWEIRDSSGGTWPADAVILACPAYEQSALLTEVDPELSGLSGGIPYNRVAVVALGYRTEELPDRLDGFGYLSPQRNRRDVLGVQWCSSIFPGQRAPAGMVLLRALCGGWNRPEVVDWDDDRLAASVRAELRQALRVEAAPSFRRIIRWRNAIPQYHVGHLDRLARIDARLAAHPGLFLGGNAYRGIALPDCVEQAGLLAGRVAAWLDRQPRSSPTVEAT
jgi:oxygen-dependent protoporphyrinogen oxidase